VTFKGNSHRHLVAPSTGSCTPNRVIISSNASQNSNILHKLDLFLFSVNKVDRHAVSEILCHLLSFVKH
jgi:hypothetical protein